MESTAIRAFPAWPGPNNRRESVGAVDRVIRPSSSRRGMYTAQGKIDQTALVEQYLPVVRRQALALQVRLPAGIELDDLIQAGMMGLLDAMGRYDASAGATFT